MVVAGNSAVRRRLPQVQTDRVAGYAWLCALGVAILLFAWVAHGRSMQVEEYAIGRDPFGYLRTGREIRHAASKQEWPQFRLEAPQIRVLIDTMRSRGGGLLGFATVSRLPVVFPVPGLLRLLRPSSGRPRLQDLTIPFALGVILIGVLPVVAHQHNLAGTSCLPTYGRSDTAAPSLGVLGKNVAYHLRGVKGVLATERWSICSSASGGSLASELNEAALA